MTSLTQHKTIIFIGGPNHLGTKVSDSEELNNTILTMVHRVYETRSEANLASAHAPIAMYNYLGTHENYILYGFVGMI